ncbi:trigger factor [Metamycoplasma hyosynoviae]|uniref:Trigger factor n=1 Tax=Metamycoplasma hyosynoviae TaxID=29559 RepID=A0A4P1QGL8_9BACT|nr:trigger factor [Metamycoplasma hyosynoviae]ASI54009.1 hypothetical protein MHSN_02345 [Metamycoplasma hyosynoviae]MDC8911814.1 trigger factor [Metamycoplasma hyosynoviae]MDC8916565.1 trigger factor [Metamycoplasma hyosynoviae]MDC8919162.1 trigger factor [Metamycoplasma hyosynoviae]MDC8962788.1 trigger factor [Metamycoplasma hyosynoviae]
MPKTLDKNTSTMTITYSVEGDIWYQFVERARKALRLNTVVPGFRKGHAPAAKADAYISPTKLFEKATSYYEEVVDKYIYPQIVQEDEIYNDKPYSIRMKENPKGEGYILECDFMTFPEIKLGDYHKKPIKILDFKPTTEDIETEKAKLLNKYIVMVESDQPIKKGDEVNFDFKGYIDGKAFEGGEATGYDLKIGSKQFIAGFEDQMIGLKKGQEKTIDVTFPEDYAKNYAGKKAKFDLKINFVKTISLPELNDAFFKNANLYYAKNIKEFEEKAKYDALALKLNLMKKDFAEKIQKTIAKVAKMNLNPEMIEREIARSYDAFLKNLADKKISEIEYYEITNSSKEEVKETLKENAILGLKGSFGFGQIVKEQKIATTEKEYEKHINELATSFGVSAQVIKSYLSFDRYEMEKTTDKVIDFLLKQNGEEVYAEISKLEKEVEAFNKKITDRANKATKIEKEKLEAKAKESKETKTPATEK